MNDFKGDTVTMKIRMSELVKDTVPEQYVINQTPMASPFSSCFKDGVLSLDVFKQTLKQTEQTTETQQSHWVADHNSPGFKAEPPTESSLLDIYRFTVPYHHNSPCRKAVDRERRRLRRVLESIRSRAGNSFTDAARSRIHKALRELERIHVRCIDGRRGVHYSDAPPAYISSLRVHELITRLYPVFKKEDTGARYEIKEPNTETKPVTEVQAAPEDPLYTFVIT